MIQRVSKLIWINILILLRSLTSRAREQNRILEEFREQQNRERREADRLNHHEEHIRQARERMDRIRRQADVLRSSQVTTESQASQASAKEKTLRVKATLQV